MSPGAVALLTYTSGTTGDPRGAMNTLGNVVFNAQSYWDWSSLSADGHRDWEIAPPRAAGARSMIAKLFRSYSNRIAWTIYARKNPPWRRPGRAVPRLISAAVYHTHHCR